MDLSTAFTVAGGLGLFLFGMKMMSNGIEIVAGDRLQSILQKATSNRILAVIVGIVATIALNSSTATTIMTISFVNSGLMTLAQAIGVIMGANVGTTLSTQLVAFRIDTVAPLFIFIGAMIYLFVKKKRYKNIGYIVLGFGVLFFGISVMGAPLRVLANDPAFNSMLTTFQNPALALLVGFAFTAIVQSSSAALGLLVTLHLSGVPMSFETSAFIILGTNIGSGATSALAAIPASRESKRAALFQIVFNIIGSVIVGTLIYTVPAVLVWFEGMFYEPARQVAMFHSLYNITIVALALPFVGLFAKLSQKIIPIKESDKKATIYEKKLIYLDSKISQSAAVIIANAHLELVRIHKIANETLELALTAFFDSNEDKAKQAIKNKKVIHFLTRKASSRLAKFNTTTLSKMDSKRIPDMFRILYAIERIADHAENISEYVAIMKENEISLSEPARKDMHKLSELVRNVVTTSFTVFESQDTSKIDQLENMIEQVETRTAKLTENHIQRLTAETCEPRAGVIFTDMLIDLERSAVHVSNIAIGTQSARRNKSKRKGSK